MTAKEEPLQKRKKPRKPLSEEGKPGRYDPRNSINDLTGKDWLLLSRSYWETEPSPDDRTAYSHPAPFLVRDVRKLISLFTKKRMTILDPFAGSGTALLAALQIERRAVGVDINPEYAELAKKRLAEKGFHNYTFIVGDSREKVPGIAPVDYIVTSPPYHNILRNNGKGVRHWSGKLYRMAARSGVEAYTDMPNDLGNQDAYEDFVRGLREIMRGCLTVLRPGRYCTIIISDFTVNKAEVCVQADIVALMTGLGFEFCGTTVLFQPVKPLFPFGYPYAYKINHHHQNLITFRRPPAMASSHGKAKAHGDAAIREGRK
jgi:DNA modification methylase